jgi:CheY-like chemotaxis protein
MRVLIAHANEKVRAKLADVVTRGRRLSLEILTAGDGPEALDLLLADQPPDVALIDWDLPGIEAPEMCRLVRDFHHHHDTWVIVLTPRARQESASEVWRAGADDCVYTPAPAKLLSDRVTKGLCEMAPPIREAAAAAAAAAEARQAAEAGTASAGAAAGAEAAAAAGAAAESAGTQQPGRVTLRAVAPAAADLLPGVGTAPVSAFGAAPRAAADTGRPSLDAIRRGEDWVPVDEPSGLAADLRATVDPDDAAEAAELAAAPVQLEARETDADELADTPRGKITLDAVLARL